MLALVWAKLASNPLKAVALIALLAAPLAYQVGKWSGAREERAQIELRNKQATFEQLKERSEINETVSNLNDADLCAAIGGKLRNGICE